MCFILSPKSGLEDNLKLGYLLWLAVIWNDKSSKNVKNKKNIFIASCL